MNTEMKHTPGPWVVWDGAIYVAESDGELGKSVTVPLDQELVRDVKHGHWDDCKATTAEDLCLIAAAPMLLEALQNIVASLSEHDDEGMIEHAEQMIAARAAIATATQPEPTP